MTADPKHIDLLNYWNLLEYLNPVAMSRDHKVFKEGIMPWQEPQEPQIPLKPGEKPEKFKYTVYLSAFPASALFSFVRKHFHTEDQGQDQPIVNYLTAAIELDHLGKYIEGSFQLSMLPFILMQLENDKTNSAEWKEAFDTKRAGIEFSIERQYFTEEKLAVPVTLQDLEALQTIVTDHISWGTHEPAPLSYLKLKAGEQMQKTDATIINSHVLNDFREIISRGKQFNFKTPLKTYLAAGVNQQQIDYIDLNEQGDEIKESLHPNNFPDGKWPSDYTLSLMQQFAVNQIMTNLSEPGDHPIYPVNGPPGTGKTTLLKDVIAANLVAKAKEQVKIKDPQDIFKEADEIKTREGEPLIFYPLKRKYESLNEFAMVVVSSNNGAVENITKELPQKDKAGNYAQRLKYFTSFEEKHSEGENWGTIAAVLGKRDNLAAFISKVRDGEDGLIHYFNQNRKTDLQDWERAVADFNQKLAEVHAEKQRIALLIPKVEQLYALDKEYHTLLATIKTMHKADTALEATQAKVDRLNAVEEELEELRELLDEQMESNVVDTKFWEELNDDENQKKCPWYLGRLNKLQSDLFIEALKVNECFLLTANGSNEHYISNNLSVFLELINSYSTIQEIDKTNAKIWLSFLQIVPVVSTTFASIQYMLRKVKTDFIPWLFIDEAGQALPQLACGAIWRSKRVVVVGDPLQIEPVDTMPPELAKLLAEQQGLTPEELFGNHSVQNLADKASKYGTLVTNGQEEIWIGTPLKVHRRCIEPMFKIANKISYHNTMVCATPPPKKEVVDKLIVNTGFAHVEGSTKGKHYVPEQAEIVIALILESFRDLTIDDQEYPNIFVISPFSEVVKSLRKELGDRLIQHKHFLDKKKLRKWVRESVGTVHTFQGKQANSVILCLGCDAKSKTAAQWAASKPNLLNVALTRAKYRFTVVGDRALWIKLPYFKELKELPTLTFEDNGLY